MMAKKRAPIKKAAKKHAAPKKTAQAPVEIPAICETIPATLETAPARRDGSRCGGDLPGATVDTAQADVEVQTEPVAQMSVGQYDKPCSSPKNDLLLRLQSSVIFTDEGADLFGHSQEF